MKKSSVLMPEKGLVYGYLAPLFTIALFIVLIGISVFTFYYTSKTDRAALMADEIALLATIFIKIDASCEIIAFQNQKNPINFLTVKKGGFIGSEVGSMSLAFPEKWEGPYVTRNLETEGIEYQVVRTKKGHFITPGDGVVLPNGKMIGKDIVLSEDADIASMMGNDQALRANGKPLAAFIEIRPGRIFTGILPEELAQAQQEWLEKNRTASV